MVPGAAKIANMLAPRGHFTAGLALHITNSKPILFFDTLFSIGVQARTGELALVVIIIIIRLNNAAVFFTYAFLFSNGAMARALRGQGAGSSVCSQPFSGLQACKF